MKVITGNLWDELGKASILLVTTNSTLNKDGTLVMGRGAALEAKDRFKELPFRFGRKIFNTCGSGGCYGIFSVPTWGGFRIGAFQVKYHWKGDADLELIKHSTMKLAAYASMNPDMRLALNFPGIGNGKRNEREVMPIIATLPDNVFVYRKEVQSAV